MTFLHISNLLPVSVVMGWRDFSLTNKGAHVYNGNSSTTRMVMYNTEYIALLVDDRNEIPDDVLNAAILLMRAHDNHNVFSIGEFTPAAQEVALREKVPHYLDSQKTSINFVHVPGHWLTLVYEHDSRRAFIFDSVYNENRPTQVLPILKLMIPGITMENVVYPRCAQQPSCDPACGVYAIAFAFSYLLGQQPQEQCFVYDNEITFKILYK